MMGSHGAGGALLAAAIRSEFGWRSAGAVAQQRLAQRRSPAAAPPRGRQAAARLSVVRRAGGRRAGRGSSARRARARAVVAALQKTQPPAPTRANKATGGGAADYCWSCVARPCLRALPASAGVWRRGARSSSSLLLAFLASLPPSFLGARRARGWVLHCCGAWPAGCSSCCCCSSLLACMCLLYCPINRHAPFFCLLYVLVAGWLLLLLRQQVNKRAPPAGQDIVAQGSRKNRANRAGRRRNRAGSSCCLGPGGLPSSFRLAPGAGASLASSFTQHACFRRRPAAALAAPARRPAVGRFLSSSYSFSLRPPPPAAARWPPVCLLLC